MAEIYDIADRITVLRNGRRIGTAPAADYPVAEVIADMLGPQHSPLEESPGSRQRPAFVNTHQEPMLKVRDLHSDNGVHGINLDVHAGEVVGLAGLMGSGRSEFVLSLFGLDKITQGSVCVDGKEVHISNPRDAIAAGIALVPEDRRMEGLVLEHSVETNAELPFLVSKRKGWIRKGETSRLANQMIRDMDVRTSSPRKTIGMLSGGNQQKVVIGKWLLTDPKVFVLDEPTAGIDIGSKTEIARKLRQYAASGKAVLVISSELEELLEVSDRIVVLRDGRVDDAYEGQEFTSEESLHRAVQGVLQ
jgi:ribose transport system ATP-binding protein